MKKRCSPPEGINLPAVQLMRFSRLSMQAGRELLVENHRGISELDSQRIILIVPEGRISVSGAELQIRAMNSRCVLINGRIEKVEFGGFHG